MTRCGKIKYILDSKQIDTKLKLRLYESSVCSLRMFDCEIPTTHHQRTMLYRFTGKTNCEEVSPPPPVSLNLTLTIRQTDL